MNKEKIEKDNKVSCKLKCECSTCNGNMNHLVLSNILKGYSQTFDNGMCEIWGDDDYQIIECQGCGDISFRHKSRFSEDMMPWSDGGTEYLYPERSMRNEILFTEIPSKVYDIYIETIKSYNCKNYILSAAGLRAIVECICKDKNILKGRKEYSNDPKSSKKEVKDLEGKIFGLFHAGYISKMQIDDLHELRFLGNTAIHEIEKPLRQQIELGLDLIETMIKSIYVSTKKGESLRIIRSEMKITSSNNTLEKKPTDK